MSKAARERAKQKKRQGFLAKEQLKAAQMNNPGGSSRYAQKQNGDAYKDQVLRGAKAARKEEERYSAHRPYWW
jgi:hypothetical protein